MGRVMLDSSVLIALFDPHDVHHEVVLSKLESADNHYEISAIVLMETLVAPFAMKPNLVGQMRLKMAESIAEIHPVDEEVAVAAARIRARTNMKVPDALISATATLVGAELWTLDQRLAKAHKGAVLIA